MDMILFYSSFVHVVWLSSYRPRLTLACDSHIYEVVTVVQSRDICWALQDVLFIPCAPNLVQGDVQVYDIGLIERGSETWTWYSAP